MTEALDEAEAELQEQKRLAEAARRARLVATARFTTQSVDPFDVLHLDPVKPRGWDAGRQLTEKQRSLLAKQGINPDGDFVQPGQAVDRGDLPALGREAVLVQAGEGAAQIRLRHGGELCGGVGDD